MAPPLFISASTADASITAAECAFPTHIYSQLEPKHRDLTWFHHEKDLLYAYMTIGTSLYSKYLRPFELAIGQGFMQQLSELKSNPVKFRETVHALYFYDKEKIEAALKKAGMKDMAFFFEIFKWYLLGERVKDPHVPLTEEIKQKYKSLHLSSLNYLEHSSYGKGCEIIRNNMASFGLPGSAKLYRIKPLSRSKSPNRSFYKDLPEERDVDFELAVIGLRKFFKSAAFNVLIKPDFNLENAYQEITGPRDISYDQFKASCKLFERADDFKFLNSLISA